MVTIQPDPQNPDKLVLSAMVTIYIDKVMLMALSEELDAAIRQQAIKDLQGNKAVRKEIQQAATKLLLKMLGIEAEPQETK